MPFSDELFTATFGFAGNQDDTIHQAVQAEASGSYSYELLVTNRFVVPAGDFSTLVRYLDNSYSHRLKGGTDVRFDVDGFLTRRVDRNGIATVYACDAKDRLISPGHLLSALCRNLVAARLKADWPSGKALKLTW